MGHEAVCTRGGGLRGCVPLAHFDVAVHFLAIGMAVFLAGCECEARFGAALVEGLALGLHR